MRGSIIGARMTDILGVWVVLLPLLLLFIIITAMGGVAYYMYRRRILLFKKELASSSSVSYHSNVVSFTNPVMEQKMVSSTLKIRV